MVCCGKIDTGSILDCQAESVVLEWEEEFVKVQEWLSSNNSCPGLRNLVIRTMMNWKQKIPIVHDEFSFDSINDLIRNQDSIG